MLASDYQQFADSRTLIPKANAVHAGTASVMCSYNRVNGNYSCANSETLNTILKEELAFKGYVVSDWDATHSTERSANGGLDMEMPGTTTQTGAFYYGDLLLAAVNNGSVSLDRLNDMAIRIMMPYYLLGQDQGFPTPDPSSGAVILNYVYGYQSPLSGSYPAVEARDVRADHAKVVRKIGAAGTVLLKNTNGALPLTNETNIGLFGNDVPYPTIGSVFLGDGGAEGYEMGTLDVGGGSGTVRHTSFSTPEEAISNHVQALGGRVQKLFDNNEIADGRFRTIYPKPQACLVFLKAYASEGEDRPSLDLQWNATAVVESTAAFCPNTIVVTHGPGVVAMPWADNENVTAILAAHYPGEESGNAIVDVLWGAVEPSGRLPYSIPKNSSDYGPPVVDSVANPMDPNAWQADYTEGQMIDYRQFDANGTQPLFEFGFGLSYSTFAMSRNLSVELTNNSLLSALPDKAQGIAPGGLVDLWNIVAAVKVVVTNTGDRAGAVVPQLYIAFPQDHTPPGTSHKVLRGFKKLHLGVGEHREVVFELMRRDLSYWDVEGRQWVVPQGVFGFQAGFSSRDLVAVAQKRIII
jgi:beta-glucosidase